MPERFWQIGIALDAAWTEASHEASLPLGLAMLSFGRLRRIEPSSADPESELFDALDAEARAAALALSLAGRLAAAGFPIVRKPGSREPLLRSSGSLSSFGISGGFAIAQARWPLPGKPSAELASAAMLRFAPIASAPPARLGWGPFSHRLLGRGLLLGQFEGARPDPLSDALALESLRESRALLESLPPALPAPARRPL